MAMMRPAIANNREFSFTSVRPKMEHVFATDYRHPRGKRLSGNPVDTLARRPRESGDPGANDWKLWVPAFAGTTGMCQILELDYTLGKRGSRATASVLGSWIPAFAGMTNELLTCRDSFPIEL